MKTISAFENEVKHFIKNLGEPFKLVTQEDFWEFDFPEEQDTITFTLQWNSKEQFCKDFIFSRHLDIQMIDFERKAILVRLPMEVLYYKYSGSGFIEKK